ncbi:tyrosine-type recombinase/integrase [Enterobacter roggenkampii]
MRRHHMYDQTFQRLQTCRRTSRHHEPATPHTLRHSVRDDACSAAVPHIRTVQDLLGHSDVSTTMIYTHVLKLAVPECAHRDALPPSLVKVETTQVNLADSLRNAKAIGAASNGRLRKVLPASLMAGSSPSLPDGSTPPLL